MFSFSLSFLPALSYVPLFPTYTTYSVLYSILLSTNNCSVNLYNGNLPTTTVLFTHNFSQVWLNSCCSLSALSCHFKVQPNQSKEHSWSRMFMSSNSIATSFLFVYCIHIVVCVFAYLSIPFYLGLHTISSIYELV